MKVSLYHYGVTHSVETERDDLTLTEVLAMFKGLVLSAGWNEESWGDAMEDDLESAVPLEDL